MNLKVPNTVPGIKKKKKISHSLSILSLNHFTRLIIYVLCNFVLGSGSVLCPVSSDFDS